MPLAGDLAALSSVTLDHDESVVSFEFAALSFLAPSKVEVRYRLEGFDDDWIDIGTNRRATYTNLSPGNYVFPCPQDPKEMGSPEFVKKYIAWGAGPRASLNLILAGKARAALRGRCHVSAEDVRELCLPVLRHRIIPNFAARSEGMNSDTLIKKLLDEIPADEKLYKNAG